MEACYTTIHGRRKDSDFLVLPAASNYSMVKKVRRFFFSYSVYLFLFL